MLDKTFCYQLHSDDVFPEQGSKVFNCFLDVHKAFATVWIDSLLYKRFTELGIKGKMWLLIKD